LRSKKSQSLNQGRWERKAGEKVNAKEKIKTACPRKNPGNERKDIEGELGKVRGSLRA